MKCADGVKFN